MLGVHLREHHELGIRGVPARPVEQAVQVAHLRIGKCEPEGEVGAMQRIHAIACEIDNFERLDGLRLRERMIVFHE